MSGAAGFWFRLVSGRRFSPAVFIFWAILLTVSGDAASDLPPNDDLRNRAWRYKPCRDDDVASLVGQERIDALRKVHAMGLMIVRFLAPTAPVTYEVFPERLTLVIDDRDRILRAFCR